MSKIQENQIDKIISELSRLEIKLEKDIDTTMWISDPHGAGKRFVSILKGRFGLVWRSAFEALPKTTPKENIRHIERIIRKEHYLESENIRLDRQDIISSLVKIIRSKVNNIRDYNALQKKYPKDLESIIDNLLLDFHVPNLIYENNIIADKIISILTKIVKQVILGRLIVLGDVFDRGDEPDKIIRILASSKIQKYVRFVWGNHDILWMGAVAGNKPLIAEALRISIRYDNTKFLKRMNIDISKLENLAEKLYPAGVSCNVKAKEEKSKKMEKTLAIIQLKLEEKIIKRHPEYEMDERLQLCKLAKLIKTNKTNSLTDTNFPTLNLKKPSKLSDEEKEVIDDLAKQFISSKPLHRLIKFLFEIGNLYYIYDYILNIHALVPSTKEGKLDTWLDKKGMDLFNFLNRKIKGVGQNYINHKKQNKNDLDLMFYLWCGPKSPFFGKNAMKTFERYFYKDKDSHKEEMLHWGKNIENEKFMNLLLKDFGVERIVYGHTPVNILKGQKIASPDGRAINIDGGFSDSYLSRGHSLINTPYSLFAIILPSQEEVISASKNKESVKLLFEEIVTYEKPKKFKDSYTGKIILKKRNELQKELEELSNN